MGLKLEWDEKKAAANLKKRGVSFEERPPLSGIPCRSRSVIRNIPV